MSHLLYSHDLREIKVSVYCTIGSDLSSFQLSVLSQASPQKPPKTVLSKIGTTTSLPRATNIFDEHITMRHLAPCIYNTFMEKILLFLVFPRPNHTEVVTTPIGSHCTTRVTSQFPPLSLELSSHLLTDLPPHHRCLKFQACR